MVSIFVRIVVIIDILGDVICYVVVKLFGIGEYNLGGIEGGKVVLGGSIRVGYFKRFMFMWYVMGRV